MANFCENCGSPLKSDNKFCTNCGAPVNQSDVPPASVAAAPIREGSAAAPVDDGTAASVATAASATVAAAAAQEKTQEAFVPPQPQQEAVRPAMQQPQEPPKPDQPHIADQNAQQSHNGPQSPEQSAFTQNAEKNAFSSTPIPKETFARSGATPKYEPDKDLKSKFFRFDNRLNRKRYIIRSLSLLVVVLVLLTVLGVILYMLSGKSYNTTSLTIGKLIAAILLIPSYSLIIRRLHDLNRPGWWCAPIFINTIIKMFLKGTQSSALLSIIGGLIALASFIVSVYILFFKGTDGPNQYGPDPLEVKD